MGGFGSIWHWIIVLIIVLLLFGAGKLPRLMGDMAKGVKAFKQGLREDDEETAPKAIDKSSEANAAGVSKDEAAKH